MNIRLEGIQVHLPGSNRILFRIRQLEFPAGSKVLIQGASGKGKTTLLHLLAGLFLPDQGDVFLGQYRLGSLGDEERARLRKRHLGIVFQKLNLLDYLTAAENVQLALSDEPVSRGLAIQALEQVNLGGRDKDLSGVLSLGEQQRVAVARVLAAKPSVILADEPTSSLDGKNSEWVIDALFQAAGKDRTLIVVSHDERIRSRFASKIDFEEFVPA